MLKYTKSGLTIYVSTEACRSHAKVRLKIKSRRLYGRSQNQNIKSSRSEQSRTQSQNKFELVER